MVRDPAAAFGAFEAERKPRGDRVRSESRRLGRLGAVESRLGCRARNLAVGLLPPRLLREARRRRAAGTWLPEDADPEVVTARTGR